MTQKLGGRYELHEELVRYNDTRLYRATDTELQRPVVLKVMVASTADTERFIRVQEEGVVLSSLDHPNIWKVYGTFIDAGLLCIVLEPGIGRTLAQVLEAGPLSLARTKYVALQITSALIYAHARAVLHCDLNPDHIVLDDTDGVKLRDLNERGMARLAREAASTTSAPEEPTPYVAPEQIRGFPVDPRTDVYSLGAILYRMLMGHPPRRDVLDLDGAPSGWSVVIARAMAGNRRYRYQSMQEMEDAIRPLPPREVTPMTLEVQPEGKRCPKCGWRGERQFCGACGTRLVEA